MHSRALHRTRLHYALVLSRRLHHLDALIDYDADRFFDIDILAGLTRLDGHIRMPVIRRRDAEHVDRFVGKDFAKITNPLRGPTGLLVRHLDRRVKVPVEDIAHGGDLQVFLTHRIAEIRSAHLSHADKGRGNPVVGTANIARKNLRSERDRSGGFKKIPTMRVHDVDYCTSLKYFSKGNFERGIGGAKNIVDAMKVAGGACDMGEPGLRIDHPDVGYAH